MPVYKSAACYVLFKDYDDWLLTDNFAVYGTTAKDGNEEFIDANTFKHLTSIIQV